jgi:tRNA(adenine34) deaminase
MCVGALVHARVARVVYGASEPRAGAIHSNLGLHEMKHFNHSFEVTGGVLEEECRSVMKAFFEARR